MPEMSAWIHRGILLCTNNVTPEPTVDTTPRIITAFNSAPVAVGMTVSHVNNNITVSEAGVYFAVCSICFSGSANATFDVRGFVNGVPTDMYLSRKLGAGGDVGSATVQGIVTLGPGDVMDIRQSTADGNAFTCTAAQLCAWRISN
jgi:hypothetical protein